MHELSIASAILDRALATATDHDAEVIEELTVEVGKATHVNPDQLRFCVETVVEDTIAADATVTIETVTPEARCECGWSGEPGRVDAASYAPEIRCPECGDRTALERGRECRLASIEVPERSAETPG